MPFKGNFLNSVFYIFNLKIIIMYIYNTILHCLCIK